MQRQPARQEERFTTRLRYISRQHRPDEFSDETSVNPRALM
jgi:hypothetical protein